MHYGWEQPSRVRVQPAACLPPSFSATDLSNKVAPPLPKMFKTAHDAIFLPRIWYFGFQQRPPPLPCQGWGRVGGWRRRRETQSSCPEKHTPSFGCLHLLGMSVAVSIATGVKEVGMSQRYGVPSAVDCWTRSGKWSGKTGSGRGRCWLTIISAWTCGSNQSWSPYKDQLLCLSVTLIHSCTGLALNTPVL